MAKSISELGVSKSSVEQGGLDLSTVTGVLEHYMNLIITGTKEQLEGNNSNATHQLTQSIRPEFTVKSEKFGMVYTAQILMEEYYEWVDKGRPAGKMPPLEDIVQWVRHKEGFRLRGKEKLGDIRERGKNKRKAYTMEDIVRANAFGVARKIGLRGTKPTNFFTNVVNQEFYNNLNKDLSKALKKDVEVTIRNLTDSKNKLVSGVERFK